MKKKLYWPAILLLMFFSCKKDHSVVVAPDGKKYVVNLSVSNPSAALSAVSNKAVGNVSDGGRKFHSQSRTAADTLKKYVKTLEYLVYDSSGALIQQLAQDSTIVNFGNVSYNFDAGTYTIVVLGNAMIPASISQGSLPVNYFYYSPSAKPDLFYQKISLTVAGSNINQVINLNRLTSQIQIKSTGAVPSNVDSVKVTFAYDYTQFSVSSGLPILNNSDYYSFSLHHKFTPAERGNLNFTLATFVYNTTTPMTVTIARYPSSIYPYPIVINNVTCSSNKITVLTGNVFQINTLTDGFQISFDPVWNIQNYTFNY